MNLSKIALQKSELEKHASLSAFSKIPALWRNSTVSGGLKRMFSGAGEAGVGATKGVAEATKNVATGTFERVPGVLRAGGNLAKETYHKGFTNFKDSLSLLYKHSLPINPNKMNPEQLKAFVASATPAQQKAYARYEKLRGSVAAGNVRWKDYTNRGGRASWAAKNVLGGIPALSLSPGVATVGLGAGAYSSGSSALDKYKTDQIMEAYQGYQGMPLLSRLGFAAAPGMGSSEVLKKIKPSQYGRLIRSGQIDPSAISKLYRSGDLSETDYSDIINQLSK